MVIICEVIAGGLYWVTYSLGISLESVYIYGLKSSAGLASNIFSVIDSFTDISFCLVNSYQICSRNRLTGAFFFSVTGETCVAHICALTINVWHTLHVHWLDVCGICFLYIECWLVYGTCFPCNDCWQVHDICFPCIDWWCVTHLSYTGGIWLSYSQSYQNVRSVWTGITGILFCFDNSLEVVFSKKHIRTTVIDRILVDTIWDWIYFIHNYVFFNAIIVIHGYYT